MERPKKPKPTTPLEKARAAEEQRRHDARVEREDYLKRYRDLPAGERTALEKEVEGKLAELTEKQLQYGRLIHEENAIIEIMERRLTEKNDQIAGRICETRACEPAPVPYLSRRERGLYSALARVLKRFAEKRAEIAQ